MRKWMLSALALMAATALFGFPELARAQAPATGGDALLGVHAQNDNPVRKGPVQVMVQGWDVRGNETLNSVLEWTAGDKTFSTNWLNIPKTTRVLRFTFVNEMNVAKGDTDARNQDFLLDYFSVNYLTYQGQNFDRTGGCQVKELRRKVVALCENEGDWVEYDLHPGNPVGPNPDGPGDRTGPQP